jgi:PAS domain S-box-containing protein
VIWNSIPIMTAFDLPIIGVAIYGIWRCWVIGSGRRAFSSRTGLRVRGLWLITLGLLAVCLFYSTDLISMYVLPATSSEEDAMAFMDALHRNASWPVVLFAVITITTGTVEVLTELREREAKIRRLVESNVVGVFVGHLDGLIIDANEAFLSMLGYDRDDLLSHRLRWTELTPADWRADSDRRVAELRASGAVKPSEKEYLHKNGNCVPVLVGGAMFEEMQDEGVAFVIDLTDRKQAEAAIRQAQRRLHETQMELAHANRVVALGHLSASIAHEINQPIASPIANASGALLWLAREAPDLEKARQALDRIVLDSKRASEVIRPDAGTSQKGPAREGRCGDQSSDSRDPRPGRWRGARESGVSADAAR